MRIGIPKESSGSEHRVGLTPFGVARLGSLGHEVYVEHDAGRDAHFNDSDYAEAGAHVVYQREEVYQRADLVVRVSRLNAGEAELLAPGSTLCGFMHLAVAPRDVLAALRQREISVFGYETVEDAGGRRPIQAALSEIAAHLAVHRAGHLLTHGAGGRGVLLGKIPGVPPATVVILGAGTVGHTAAQLFLANGAHVILLDAELERLRQATATGFPQPVTALASARNLGRYTRFADVFLGAVAVPGGRSPFVVTEEMVQAMKPGSVIVDLSISQGGCVATSRPTTLASPTYVAHGVTHLCVPNLTADTPRTTSRALTLAALPFLLRLADNGIDAALAADGGLERGIYLYRGQVVSAAVASALGETPARLADLLA
jgi:alanine dehydrogenase